MPASSMPVPVQPGLPSLPPASLDGEESSSGMSVAQVLCIVQAFWKHSLIIFLAVVAVAAFAIRAMPKEYVATTTLLVNHETQDPLAGPGREVPQTFIPTQIELITGAGVLQKVIDRMDLSHDRQFTGGFKGTPAAQREVVLTNLQKALTVQGGKGSQLLYIAAAYSSPEKAAQLANTVTEEYLRQARDRTAGNESLSRYEHDLEELRRKATDAQAKVSEFRKAHGLIDIEQGAGPDIEQTALTDLETKLLAAQDKRRELESQQLSPDSSADAVLRDAAVTQLRGRLGTLREQLQQMLSTLGPRHPNVVELQTTINATERSLQQEVAAISKNNQSELGRAREFEAKLQAAVDAQRTKVVERRSVRDQAGEMLLQEKSAEETYKKALDGYDVKRFKVISDNGDVTLVNSAVPPAKADKPKKPKLFLMALMGALAAGLGGPFAYELLLNRRLRCRDDLERAFGMPVLAQLGPIEAGGA